MGLLLDRNDGEVIAEMSPIVDFMQSMVEALVRNASVVAVYRVPERRASIQKDDLLPSVFCENEGKAWKLFVRLVKSSVMAMAARLAQRCYTTFDITLS